MKKFAGRMLRRHSIIFFSASALCAQINVSDELRSQVALSILNSVRGAEYSAQKDAINAFEQKITKFQPEDREAADLLEFFGTQGTKVAEKKGSLIVNNFPDIRAKACVLLGQLGGDFARNACIAIVTAEVDSPAQTADVLARGYNALGIIGDDDQYRASKAVINSFHMTRDRYSRVYEIMVLNCVLSLESLALKMPLPVAEHLGILRTIKGIIAEEKTIRSYNSGIYDQAKKSLTKIMMNAL